MHRRHSRSWSGFHSYGPVRRAGAGLTAFGLGVLVLTSCAGDSGPMEREAPGGQPTSAPAATHPSDDADLDDASPGDAAPDEPTPGDADPGEAEPDGGDGTPDMIPTPVEETPELVFEHLSSWEERASPSESELQLAFYSGNPACYGVRSVVEEDDEEVRVATISGTLPDAVDSACTQEARYVSLIVELEEPLGEREVVPLTEVELAR